MQHVELKNCIRQTNDSVTAQGPDYVLEGISLMVSIDPYLHRVSFTGTRPPPYLFYRDKETESEDLTNCSVLKKPSWSRVISMKKVKTIYT